MIKRILARLVVAVLAMGGLSAVTVATAQPALASACGALGRVYETNFQPWAIKYETDPINGSFIPTFVDVPNDGNVYIVYVRLGGANLTPGSTPTWDVFSGGGGYIGFFGGSKTNSGCVSNEKFFPIFGSAGDVYNVKANYDSGTTAIRGQNHFSVTFF